MAVRILPKDEARVRFSYPALGRLLVVGALVVSLANPTHAAALAPTVWTLTEAETANGLTLTTADDALRLGLTAGALTGGATVTATPLGAPPIPVPTRYRVVGAAWKFDVVGTVVDPKVPVSLLLPGDANLYRKFIFQLTPGGTGWVKLERATRTDNRVQAYLKTIPTTLLAVDDTESVEGVTSWYRSKRYPNGAASNDFPLGSRLKVTNLETGKSTTVKVVSTGPFVPGRVLDMTHGPFALIASRGAGLARVRVELLTGGAVKLTAEADRDAGGTPVLNGTVAPTVTAAAAVVLDQGTDTVLFAKNADAPRPIASITKLMNAAVFLDTKPDLDRSVAYRSADRAIGGALRMSYGETAYLKDYLGAALVGSANNAAKVLARSTELTTAEFVARMNAKAASWGLTSVQFTDTHGLDPGNIGSATDIAKMSERIFAEYPLVRDYTRKTRYNFRTVSSGVYHAIKPTNILNTASPLALTGGKTGYLDEARYTMVQRARDTQGHQIVAVVLGAGTSAARFAETDALLGWALKNATWSG